jgi:hypothetical protein
MVIQRWRGSWRKCGCSWAESARGDPSTPRRRVRRSDRAAHKYHYDFRRLITAIRNGDLDNNPGTERDATWLPIEATPMHPEYPCAHCIQSGSVASVVKAVLGTVDIAEVALTSPTAPGVTHRWPNLDAYTEEVANARI